MKKNISINLQGLIFHIEEDGYDVLSRYLAEVRAHFSGYRGHEEIVGDIEGRIAELFAARTSPTKPVITRADVQEMVGKMGRVSDFQSADEAEEEEEALAGGPQTYTNYAKAGNAATAAAEAEAAAGPKRLYRDMANRKIAGVAAGIASYFAVNPLWIRLAFLGFLLFPPIVFDDHNNDFGGNIAGFSLIAYIILWIALPKRYDTVAGDEDPTFKKLYRDTDTGKVGGVSAGLSAYFKVDVVLIRVLFVAFVFAGGFAIPLYIILWILLPEAKTVSDRMRMRGDALTLSSLDTNLRNNSFEEGTEPPLGNNRPVGTFLENFFRNVRPLLNFVGSIMRIFIGILMTITGFGILLALIIALLIGLGLIPESQNFVLGDVPAYVIMNGIPDWALLAFFLVAAIPPLAMMLSGLGLLLRRSILSRTAGLTMFGLWLLGVVGASIAGAQISRDFQEESQVVQNQRFPAFTAASSIYLDARKVDRPSDQWVDVELAGADSGAVVQVDKTFAANGATEEEARQIAVNSVAYTVRQSNDSTLLFDDHFSYRSGAKFRGQEVSLLVHLPRNKTFRISDDFSRLLDDDNFVNDQRPTEPTEHSYRLRGNLLECADCTGDDLEDNFGSGNEEEESDTTDTTVDVDTGDENFRIRVNTDDDEDGTPGIDIDIDDKGFPTSPGSYGTGRRTFNLNSFRTIEASGAYRVLVRQGPEFKVDAAGEERDLRNLRVETNGDELFIRSRSRTSFMPSFSFNHKPLLIRVQMPELTGLDLNGACQANVAGFKDQALHVEQSGACHAMLNVNVPRLDLDMSGACRTDLRGSANDLNVEGSGACQVQGLRMVTQMADFDLSGMSKARIRVAKQLRAELSGASRVEYAGSPSRIQKEVSGSSRVVRLKSNDGE
jgi:phage shock protein PspC (stress-responsive transcriptional regulator)